MNDPEITRKSPGNHPVITPFSRLITSTLLLLFTLAIGNVWADEIFSWTATSQIEKNASEDATGGTVKCTGSGFGSESPSGSGFYKFNSSTQLTCTLSSGTFAAGDEITFTFTSAGNNKTVGVELQETSPVTQLTEKIATAGTSVSKTYTVKASDRIEGQSKFSIKRVDSNFSLKAVSVTRSGGGDPVCPSGLTISSKNDKTAFYTGDAIELTAALSEGNGAITYQWYKGGTEEANKLTGKTAAKLEIASCVEGDAGDYYCVASKSGCSPAAVNTDAFTITVTPSPCVTVTGADQFVADYTINGAYVINSGCGTSNGALKIDNGADYVEIYAPVGKKISLIEMSLYAGDSKKVGYGFGASAVVDNDLTPWDWAEKDVTKSYADYEFKPISSGKAKYFRLYRKVTVDKDYGSGTSTFINKICVTLENTVAYAITYNLNGGTGTTPMESDKEAGTEVTLASGTSGITPPTDKKFNGWLVKDATDATVPVTDGKFTMPTSAVTITAQWEDVFAVTYDANGGGETMTDSNSPYAEGAEVTLLANAFTPPTGKEFDAWEVTKTASGDPVPVTDGKFTMPAEAVTVKATWKDACALDPTVSATTLGTTSYTTQVVNCAGISVLGSAGCTISEYGYVYGTSTAPTISDNKKALEGDYTVAGTAFVEATLSGLASNTTYYVRAFATNSHGTAYGDEISFTTLAPLGNVLVIAVSADHTSDAITALRDNGFIVTVSAPNPSRDYTGYDLVVLDESLSGGNGVAGKEEGDIKGVNIPLLNLKSFFYNSGRWGWGTGNNGTADNEIANISAAYCNAQSHPIFAGLTITDGNIDLIDPAKTGNTLQTATGLAAGKEGYVLATVGGNAFIHELTPAQRGVTDAKYLMVAISNNAKDNLSADGEKLIVNAAKYLIGSTSWTPIAVPTDPEIAGTTAYVAGGTIELTASATGESAATTYTWYKGATLEAAKGAGAIQAAKKVAENGNVYSKAECAVGDAGTYWCVISNGTDCEANASVEITVSDASYNVSFESAHGTAPSAGSGISYTLPELTESGYVHQGWTANIDVTVDEAVVTAGTTIANGKVASFGADVKFTAVWKQIFAVTFNLNGQSGSIDPQNIIDGEKATKPADPSESGWIFGGWYKENTCTNVWDFDNDVVTEDTELFAKWTEDPCPDSEKKSIVKVVLTSATEGTVTGYNNDEYAGDAVIGGLSSTQTAEVDASHDGTETGYKLNNGGSAIVFATLAKGTFQEGDKVVITITKQQDAYKIGKVAQPILDIYYGTNKDDATFLTTIENVTAAGTYTYRLTAADVTAIGDKKGIGVFRPSSGRTQNPYVYSVEIQGCRSWAVFHTLTFKNIDGTATIAAEPLEEGAAASTVAPAAPKITLKRFLGWAEAIDGTPVDLTTYTIAEDKILYAVYEDIVCPTSGTVYKFEIKDELPSENLPTSTDKDMSSYITATGDGYLTYTATANNKATINSDGTIQLKDASAAYLKVELECALAAGDQIRAHITGNPMRVQVAATYDSDKDLILAKDDYTFVDITSAMVGKQVLYITRSSNGNANLADFEIYRRPALTGVTMDDMIVRVNAVANPEMTLTPSNDAIVTAQAWSIVSGSDKITINPATGAVTGVAAGDAVIKVVLNEDEVNFSATATVHVVNDYTRQDVTGSMKWNWANTGPLSGVAAQENNNVTETLLANIGTMPNNADFRSDMLVTTCQHAYRKNTGNGCWQGTEIKFYTTVPGAVKVNYMGTGGSDEVTLSINNWSNTYTGSWADSKTIVVPAGWVTIRASESNKLRIKTITFTAAADLDPAEVHDEAYYYGGYDRNVTEGRYGTICLPNGGVMTGAELYEVAYYDGTYEKIFLDEVLNGEMVAGRPYIFLTKEGVNQIAVFYTDEADAPEGNYQGLFGSYTRINLAANDHIYILKDNRYYFVDTDNVYCGENRAYFKMGVDGGISGSYVAPAPGRRRTSIGAGAPAVATGVEDVQGDNVQCTKVLINGELFIIRGEKMYDAKGQLVK